MYIKNTKLKKRIREAIRDAICKDIEPATKALVVSELIAIFHPRDGKS